MSEPEGNRLVKMRRRQLRSYHEEHGIKTDSAAYQAYLDAGTERECDAAWEQVLREAGKLPPKEGQQ